MVYRSDLEVKRETLVSLGSLGTYRLYGQGAFHFASCSCPAQRAFTRSISMLGKWMPIQYQPGVHTAKSVRKTKINKNLQWWRNAMVFLPLGETCLPMKFSPHHKQQTRSCSLEPLWVTNRMSLRRPSPRWPSTRSPSYPECIQRFALPPELTPEQCRVREPAPRSQTSGQSSWLPNPLTSSLLLGRSLPESSGSALILHATYSIQKVLPL